MLSKVLKVASFLYFKIVLSSALRSVACLVYRLVSEIKFQQSLMQQSRLRETSLITDWRKSKKQLIGRPLFTPVPHDLFPESQYANH